MRRKKKILLNLLKVLIVVAIILAIYFLFFKQKKKIETVTQNTSTGKSIELVPVNESTENVELPENIHSTGNPSNKSYEPITEDSEQYLISILANNEVTILIGNDSEKLLSQNSPVKVGAEYMVSGIETELKTVYYFTVDGYDYPIFLLLSQDGKISYVDIEKAYSTGIFEVAGTIENIPEIENIYESTVETNGKTAKTAILVGKDGQGYEFSLNMIGK